MIPRRTRNGIVVLSILTALTFWLGRGGGDRPPDPIAGLDTRLDYALHRFEARYFDTQGQPAVDLWAPTLTNNASSGIGLIESPRFNVVHENRRWSIVADSAMVAADRERIFMTGAVNMRRRGPAAGGLLEVNTSEVVFDVTPRVAHSDRPVVILEGDNTLEAVGFSIDMRNDSFHLDTRVRGRYAVN